MVDRQSKGIGVAAESTKKERCNLHGTYVQYVPVARVRRHHMAVKAELNLSAPPRRPLEARTERSATVSDAFGEGGCHGCVTCPDSYPCHSGLLP